jgi:hypothetical protein
MTETSSFNRGMAAGMLLTIGSQALYWFLSSSSHPDSSTLREYAVAAEAVVGLGAGFWLVARRSTRKVS